MLALALVVAVLQQSALAPPSPALPPQLGDTSPFRRLVLPTPSLVREGSGRPGPRYWQQRADYTIRATLDTASQSLRGNEAIRYGNSTPDTLLYVWLQLDQNLFADGSRGVALNPPGTRFAGGGFVGGYTIDYVKAVRRAGPKGLPDGRGQTVRRVPLLTTVNGTVMRVDLDQPLPPGGVLSLEIAYSFQIPEHGGDRMGREQFPGGWLYELAPWYPRHAVYDDVRGWNTEQYLGQGEVYLEYGDFDVALTAPASFVVAATGTLLDPVAVLTPTQRARLATALKSDTTVPIVAKTEAGQPVTRPRPRPSGASPTPTPPWRFTAKNVRDFAWAAAPNFIWDASGWQGVLVQSFYPPEANADWARSTEFARHSIKHYSEKRFRYPYPPT